MENQKIQLMGQKKGWIILKTSCQVKRNMGAKYTCDSACYKCRTAKEVANGLVKLRIDRML